MSDSYIPLVDVGPNEEATPGTFGSVGPILNLPTPKNLANDEKIKRLVQDEVVPVVEWTRLQRTGLEEEWRAIRRMTLQRHDDGRRYLGRADSYLPVYAKIRNTLVSALSRGLFPSDEYMDVVDRGTGDPERAKPVKTYLQWEFERVGRVRAKMKPLLGQLCDTGNGIFKYWYKKEIRSEGRNQVERDMAKILRTSPSFQNIACYDGLAVSARSIFYWYLYPLTAESIDDATCVFEDIDVPIKYIEAMGRKERWVNMEAALNAPIERIHYGTQADLFNDAGEISAQAGVLGGRKLGDVRTLTEVWTFLQLPKSEYLDHEDTDAPLPVRIVLAGQVPVSVKRNPHWHQRPPYLMTRMNVEPGFVYGNAYGRMVRSLQYLANDFANQTNDCGTYALNPVVKVNPGLLAGPLPPLRPGVTWYMTDPTGAMFDRPPTDLIQWGQLMMNSVIGMAQDFGGAPPVLQGTGASKAAKTATGAQILQRNALAPLQDVVEDIELDILVPLMFGAWVNAQQFREEDVMATVAGESIRVSPDMLAIDPEFRWLASSQAVNQQTRAQQAMQLIQATAPLVPLLMQQGYVVDFPSLIKRVYADGFGFRGFSDFIRKAEPGAMGPGGMPMPGGPMGMQGMAGPPGIQAEQGDRMRSALEQIAGAGNAEAVPGEAEEFMNVRNQVENGAY